MDDDKRVRVMSDAPVSEDVGDTDDIKSDDDDDETEDEEDEEDMFSGNGYSNGADLVSNGVPMIS